jgi:predicted outer membrane protein
MRNLPGAFLLFALVACGDNDVNEVQVAGDQGETLGHAHATAADRELRGNEPEVVIAQAAGIVLTIDEGEIMHASFALQNARNADVIAFATRMTSEHTAHIATTTALLETMGMERQDSAIAADLRAEAMANLATLQEADDVDLEYMRMQVTMHAEASIIVSRLFALVDDATFGQFLTDTRMAINAHRADAERILRDL